MCGLRRGVGLAWAAVLWPKLAFRGPAWRGLAWPGLAWFGLVWPGVAWLACHGLAWPGLEIPCGMYSETFNKQGGDSYLGGSFLFLSGGSLSSSRGPPRYLGGASLSGGPLEIQENHLKIKQSLVFKDNL